MIVNLQDEHLNCVICCEPFTSDMNSAEDKNHLPVLSSSKDICDHYFCLGCVLNQQASLAQEMPHPPKWIKCMTCKAPTSFCPERPKFHRILIDFLGRAEASSSTISSSTSRNSKSSSTGFKASKDANHTHTFLKRKKTSKGGKFVDYKEAGTSVNKRANNDSTRTRSSNERKERNTSKKPRRFEGGAAAGGEVSKEASPQQQQQINTHLLPDSIDEIIRYMDKIYPAKPGYHSYFVSQQDSREGCSKTRKKLRDFARKNPQDPAISHYVRNNKWNPPDQATLDLMVNLLKRMIVVKRK